MPVWIEEQAADRPNLNRCLAAALAGPIDSPMVCPVCAATEVRVYFDRPVGRGLGSCWAWCGGCGRYTHGSVRIPAWWENLAVVERSRLESSVDYLSRFEREIDEQWVHLSGGRSHPQ